MQKHIWKKNIAVLLAVVLTACSASLEVFAESSVSKSTGYKAFLAICAGANAKWVADGDSSAAEKKQHNWRRCCHHKRWQLYSQCENRCQYRYNRISGDCHRY